MTFPTTNGSDRLQKLEERVVAYEQSIDQFNSDRALPAPVPRLISQYINMQRSELRAMTTEDLSGVVFEIAAYAYYLQDQVNQAQLRIDKLKHEINKRAFPAAQGYTEIYKFDDRILAAIYDDPVCCDLLELKAVAEGVQVRWSKLGYLLSDLKKSIEGCIQEKKAKYHA